MHARSTDDATTPTLGRCLAVAGLVAALLLAAVPAGQATTHDSGIDEGPTEEICKLDDLSGDVPGRELTEAWDYGDAPDSDHDAPAYPTYYTGSAAQDGRFPTLSDTSNNPLGQPGARHHVVSVGWLGNVQSDEGAASADVPTLERDADTQPDQDGTTTNLDPADQTPDHDGKDDGLHPTTLTAADNGQIRFRVSSSPGITDWYVNVLVDWDYDGDWRDGQGASEWAVRNHQVSVPAGQSQDFAADVDAGGIEGTPWVRVTLTPDRIEPVDGTDWDGSVPQGTTDLHDRDAFPCGETEDYCGALEVVGRDGETSGDDGIRCPRDNSGGDDDDGGDEESGCADPTVQHYTVDITTGLDESTGSRIPYGDADDDWDITTAPREANEGDAYAIPPIGPWANPSTGRWVNPDFHDDGDNDQAPETPGHYTYEASFPGDDDASLIVFKGLWSRDDWSTVKPNPTHDPGNPPTLNGFQYDETNPSLGSPGWRDIAHGWGHSHKDPFLRADLTPQDHYDLRVDVYNVLTYTGLLIEGQIEVYCDALLPLGFDPGNALDDVGPRTPFERVGGP